MAFWITLRPYRDERSSQKLCQPPGHDKLSLDVESGLSVEKEADDRVLDAFYFGSQRVKSSINVLVTAINLFDVVNNAYPFG